MAKSVTAFEGAVDLPNRELIEGTIRFSQRFLRWVGGGPQRSLSYPRLRVLESLHCNGPARMVDLAAELGLAARNLTSVADSLEDELLVHRAPHPTDRRATLLEITPTGRVAFETAMAPQMLEISKLFDELSQTEKTQLLAAFHTLERAIGPVSNDRNE